MTALKKYQRLECSALWRETPASQRVEVYVSFGNSSLVIRDKNGRALSHWSLPAVCRNNPGETPAVFAPGPNADETLEIDDETMTEAIETIQRVVERQRPHPGRLRSGVLLLMILAMVALVIFWLPGALKRHVVRVAPFETRQQIGRLILKNITRLAGKPCSTAPGNTAINDLKNRLGLGAVGTKIFVLEGGTALSAHLPGHLILLQKSLVEDYDSPDVAAAYVLIESMRAQALDPLASVLDHSGVLASFRLLTTGRLDGASLEDYTRYVLTHSAKLPETAAIISRFSKVGIATSPLAFAIDITGETTVSLIEADPYSKSPAPQILPDREWISLQSICGN